MQNAVSQLNAAYETNKWTVYCDSTGTNIKPNNSYAGGRNRANYLEIRTNKVATYGTTATLAFVFKAPGTGDYNLSVTYGTASVGDNKVAEMGAYI